MGSDRVCMMDTSNAIAGSPGHRMASAGAGAAFRTALAAALGLLMLWGIGFAGNDQWHEAAHDTRHALGFPCH